MKQMIKFNQYMAQRLIKLIIKVQLQKICQQLQKLIVANHKYNNILDIVTVIKLNSNMFIQFVIEKTDQQMAKVGGAVGVAALVAGALYLCNKNKNSDKTLQTKKKEKERIDKQLIVSLVNFSKALKPHQKDGKQFICFIGPTSVGKSTLCNELFSLNLKMGLGRTTQKAQIIHVTQTKAYFDAPGMNNDWQWFTQKDAQFFNSVDRCFLIYVGEVSQVKFIGRLLSKMGKQLIFVRNQCDKYQSNMKSVDAVLEQDRDDLNKLQINYKKIISSGRQNRAQIKKCI